MQLKFKGDMKYLGLVILIFLICSVSTVALAQWTQNSGIRIPKGSTGSWDVDMVAYPTVFFDSGTGLKHMWYSGRSSSAASYQIGYATSSDPNGLIWTKYTSNPVLKNNDPGWQITKIHRSHVIKDESQFVMWFTGEASSVFAIGRAVSSDGITWTKDADPVLSPSSPDDPQGSCDPFVIKDGSVYKMWYRGIVGTVSKICYATSPNGITWTKHGKVLEPTAGTYDKDGCLHPTVILETGLYDLWYAAKSGITYSIGHATSSDGINWTKETSAVLTGINAAGPAVAIGKCYIMYYSDMTNKVIKSAKFETQTRVRASIVNPNPLAGQLLEVDIKIIVSDLYSASFDIIYDPLLLSYASFDPTGILSPNYEVGLENGEEGRLVVGISEQADAPGKGSGGPAEEQLCKIRFNVIGSGAGIIDFQNRYLEDATDAERIIAEWIPGSYSSDNSTNPPTNLTVNDLGTRGALTVSWNAPTTGGPYSYKIYRSNAVSGSFLQIGTTSSTSYVDDPNQLFLIQGLNQVSEYYYYRVVSVENGISSSPIGPAAGAAAGILGDINKSGRVDGRDLSLLYRAWGSTSGNSGWNNLANLKRDNLIDGDDLSRLSYNFGITE